MRSGRERGIDAVKGHQIAAVVDHGNAAAHVILHRFGLGSGDHLLRPVERHGLLVHYLGRHGQNSDREKSKNPSHLVSLKTQLIRSSR